MIFLYGYLGIGIAALAIILVAHLVTLSRKGNEVAALMERFDPNRDKWWWWPLNKVILPGLAAVTVVIAWPIAIYWKAKEMAATRRSPPAEEPPRKEFAVTREHLRKQRSLAEIEAAEIVLDPMGAAPRLPFGHLNPAWETFKQSIGEDDQLWSFSVPWAAEWGRREIRDGYVVMHGDAIGTHFITRWVPADEQDQAGA